MNRKEARERARYRKDLRRELKREAKYYVPVVINAAARLGIDHYLRRSSQPGLAEAMLTGKGPRETLRVIEVRANEDALYIRIDPTRLPYRISIADLSNQEVIDTLSMACQRTVQFHADPRSGVWYVINRDDAVRAIPRLFRYQDAWQYIVESEKERRKPYPPLFFIAGVSENGKIVTGDLERMRHILTAGVTGSGKSVMVNTILCTLLLRNNPENLRIWAFDMKGGIELHDYRNVPHLERLVEEPEEMAKSLAELHVEVERRQQQIRGVARDITGYNYQARKRGKPLMPYLILIIDELADVMLLESLRRGAQIRTYLSRILAKGRACGVFVLLSTQSPNKSVVTPLIKNNVPAKIAFSCSTITHSLVVIDSKLAHGLTPRGRAILNEGGVNVEIQAPLITSREIKRVVKWVTKRYSEPVPERKERSLADEILQYGLDNLGGALPRRQLWDYFRNRDVKHDELWETVKGLHGQTVMVDGSEYMVEPGIGGRPTSLVLVTDPQDGNGRRGMEEQVLETGGVHSE